MLDAIRKRRGNDEGFTLIELMVVVLIIAILLAIAIPTFLGAQNRAKDRAAQSDLRNALTAAKTIATDQEGYFRTTTAAAITPADMLAAESSLTFAAGAGTVDDVGVTVVADAGGAVGQAVLLMKRSKSSDGYFWAIVAQRDGTVKYCKADAAADITLVAGTPATSTCAANSFANAPLL